MAGRDPRERAIENPFKGLCTVMPGTEDTFQHFPPAEVAKAISGLIHSIRGQSHFWKLHKKTAEENRLSYLVGRAYGAAENVFKNLGIDTISYRAWNTETYKLDISGDRLTNLQKHRHKSDFDLSQVLRLYWFKELNHRLQNAFLRRFLMEKKAGNVRRIREDDYTAKYEEIRRGRAGPDPMPAVFDNAENYMLPDSDSESTSDASTVVDEEAGATIDEGAESTGSFLYKNR